MYCIVPVSFEKAADNTNTQTTNIERGQNCIHTLTLKVLLKQEWMFLAKQEWMFLATYRLPPGVDYGTKVSSISG